MFLVKRLIRVSGFINKEIREVVRQPRLILTLLFGPFIILLLFGAGYTGIIPPLRAILVIPNDPAYTSQRDALQQQFGKSVDLVDITTDLAGAQTRLRANTVDVVIQLPADADKQLGQGAQAIIPVYYSEVDPLAEGRIVLGTLNYTNELNKATVAAAFSRAQGQADQVQQALGRMDTALTRLDAQVGSGQMQQAQQDATQIRTDADLVLLAGGLIVQTLAPTPGAGPPLTPVSAPPQNLTQTADVTRKLNDDMTALQQELAAPTPNPQRTHTRIEAVRDDVHQMQGLTAQFQRLNPYVMAAPFFGQGHNLAGNAAFVNFYTPGAIALLLQHIAITLGALSMVRERMRGSLEWFRVSPIGPGDILLGKYLGFLVFLSVLTVLLLGLIIFGLGVPMLGDWLWLALTLFLLTFASLGLGFSISMISGTESQAVQWAMLTLLAAVFFGGFFLNIASFWPPVQGLSYSLPVTHGIVSLQDVMLRGRAPDLFYPLMLAGLGVLFAVFAFWRFRREFQRG